MFTNAQSPAVPKREKPRRVRLLSFRLLHLRRRAVCCPSRCARGERGGFRLLRIRKISARNARISPSSRIRRRMIVFARGSSAASARFRPANSPAGRVPCPAGVSNTSQAFASRAPSPFRYLSSFPRLTPSACRVYTLSRGRLRLHRSGCHSWRLSWIETWIETNMQQLRLLSLCLRAGVD